MVQTPQLYPRYISLMTRPMTLCTRSYVEQRGLFARVARKLELDPSFVSRVARGIRRNEKVSIAIEAELKKMHVLRKRFSDLPAKKQKRRN